MLDYQSTLTQLASAYSTGYEKGEASATKILFNDSKAVAKNKLALDAYHILSELGAWVGGRESTNYSITVSGNLNGVQQKVSWNELTFEQFADMVDFSGIGQFGYYSSSRVVLKGSQELLDQFGNSAVAWGESREQEYNDFDKNVRQLISNGQGELLTWKDKRGKVVSHLNNIQGRATRWANVRKGNTLEAFLRYEELKKNNPSYSEERLMYEAMNMTMSKPAPFYQGGDIGNTQIKGDYATVVRFGTINKMLNDSLMMLQSLKSNLSNFDKSSEYSQALNISNSIYKSIEQDIDKLMRTFIDTVQR